MRMYFVYVIRNTGTGQLYFGLTKNLEQRLASHNGGHNASTKRKALWEIVYCEGYKSEKDARKREQMLKHYGNARTHLKNRIRDGLMRRKESAG